MFYRKNLYSWEALLRIAGGVAMIAASLIEVVPENRTGV